MSQSDEIAALKGRLEKCARKHAEAQERILELDAENNRLKVALKRIEAPGYGLELSDNDEYRAKYWSKLALEYREVARDALANDPSTL